MIKHGFIGAAMAAMMLWMLHDPIMAGSASLSMGALAFVLAHVVVVAGGAAVALLVPGIRRALVRHRPSLRHVAAMIASATVFAGGVHLVLHGGV